MPVRQTLQSLSICSILLTQDAYLQAQSERRFINLLPIPRTFSTADFGFLGVTFLIPELFLLYIFIYLQQVYLIMAHPLLILRENLG